MVSQQLLEYIREQTSVGSSKENIIQLLVKNGWNILDIQEAFFMISNVPSPMISSPVGYSGFWRRFTASLMDGLILVMIIIASILVLEVSNLNLNIPSSVIIVLGFVVFSLFESSVWQGTPGKKLLGLRVTDEAGNHIFFLRALSRNLLKILSVVTLGIGYFMIAFTERKQGLHDKIVGTLVMKVDKTHTSLISTVIVISILIPIIWGIYLAVMLMLYENKV